VSTPTHHAAAVCSQVLLVVASDRVSQTAITCAAGLAVGGPVTVIGVGPWSGQAGAEVDESPHAGMPGGTWRSGSHPGRVAPRGRPAAGGARQTSTEDVRRAVAMAMSVLEDTGVQALGHVAVSGPPARAVARMARARGVRAIVLDQADGLTSDLRRRVHGSGIVVVSATERGGRLAAHRDRLAR
jgi:hypothetical protein